MVKMHLQQALMLVEDIDIITFFIYTLGKAIVAAPVKALSQQPEWLTACSSAALLVNRPTHWYCRVPKVWHSTCESMSDVGCKH